VNEGDLSGKWLTSSSIKRFFTRSNFKHRAINATTAAKIISRCARGRCGGSYASAAIVAGGTASLVALGTLAHRTAGSTGVHSNFYWAKQSTQAVTTGAVCGALSGKGCLFGIPTPRAGTPLKLLYDMLGRQTIPMKKIAICVCSRHEKGNIDGNSLILSSEGLLHIFFIALLLYGIGYYVALVYVCLLGVVVLVWFLGARHKGHSSLCSARRSLLKICDLGSYITP